MCVAGGLVVGFSPNIYPDAVWFVFDDEPLTHYPGARIRRFGGAYMILTYITIYFVKLSFLFFFRIIVRRDHKMNMYWWAVFVIVIVTLFVSIMIAVFPLCQVFDTGIHYSMIRFS